MSCCTTSAVAQKAHADCPITFEAVCELKPQVSAAAALSREMLCAFAFSGCGLPDSLRPIDTATRGALSRLVHASGFTAEIGQQLEVDLRPLQADAPVPHYVVLVGLGEDVPVPADRTASREAMIIRETLCAAIGTFATRAYELAATELIVSFAGLSTHHVDLVGIAALLRCRLTIEYARHKMSFLSRVHVLCTAGERVYVSAGLAQRGPLCVHCTRPCFASETVLM